MAFVDGPSKTLPIYYRKDFSFKYHDEIITVFKIQNVFFPKGCGERNDESRIVGGSATGVNEFPWMARLSYFNRFYCGEFIDLCRQKKMSVNFRGVALLDRKKSNVFVYLPAHNTMNEIGMNRIKLKYYW